MREKWKSLHVAFKNAVGSEDPSASITPAQLRAVLHGADIVLADQQFEKLVRDMDDDGDGSLSYGEFLAFFGKGTEADRDVVGVVRGVSVDDAITLIRDKVRGRLASGPSEMRRAFQFFDRDGSGSVDVGELEVTLRHYGAFSDQRAGWLQLLLLHVLRRHGRGSAIALPPSFFYLPRRCGPVTP
eukprot:SAG25_NODE_499_length_7388_cov_11.651393_9_plen_185_part_00